MGKRKCSVPGCNTKLWINELKKSTFTASSEIMLHAWQKALAERGVTDLSKSDRICELHFEKTKIERIRNIYLPGGKILRVARKNPILAPDAVPSLFPTEIPKKIEYAVKLKPEIIAKGRKLFEKSREILEETSEKDKPVCLPKISTVISERNNETRNNLFSTLLNEVNEQKPLFPALQSWWVGKSLENNTIALTYWNKDHFIIDKRVVLSRDLKLCVFMSGREVFFPGTRNIRDRCHLEEMLIKVTEISPCAKVNDIIRAGNCIGYVRKNKGRPRTRCVQCARFRIKLQKLKWSNMTKIKTKKMVFPNLWNSLCRRTIRLGNKVQLETMQLIHV